MLGNDVRFSSLCRNGPAERRKADRKEVQADRLAPTPNAERFGGSRHLNGRSCAYEDSPEVPPTPAPGPRRIHSGLTESGTKGSLLWVSSPLSIRDWRFRVAFAYRSGAARGCAGSPYRGARKFVGVWGSPPVPSAPAPESCRVHSWSAEPGTKGSQVRVGSPLSIWARRFRVAFAYRSGAARGCTAGPCRGSPWVRYRGGSPVANGRPVTGSAVV